MQWGNDQLSIGLDDVARADIKATILTDDDARMNLLRYYRWIGAYKAGGGRSPVAATEDDEFGNEDYPFEAPFTTSPRFETASSRYRWLNDHQGIGFGKFQIVRNEFAASPANERDDMRTSLGESRASTWTERRKLLPVGISYIFRPRPT